MRNKYVSEKEYNDKRRKRAAARGGQPLCVYVNTIKICYKFRRRKTYC